MNPFLILFCLDFLDSSIRLKLSDQLLAVLVVFIWGTNFVFIRYGLDELQPFTFAALRFAFVAVPLIFFLPRPQVSWLVIASYGLLIGVGQFGLLFWAMTADISPGLASLIVQMQVFFTVFLSAVFLKEKITLFQLGSLLICFVGLLTVITYTDGSTTLFGIGLVLAAGFSWACGNMVVKQAGSVNLIAFLAWSSLFAVPPLTLIAILLEGSQVLSGIQNLSFTGWSVLMWQVIGNTLIGYGLWNWLLHRYDASLVAPWALLVPVFGMAASAVILNEPLPWWKLLAASLIFTGLTLNLIGGRQRPNKT